MKLAEILSKTNDSSNHLSIQQPYVIAEAGVNHEGDFDVAKRLIEEAAKGGADAIKFQTYKAKTLAVKNSPSYWDLTQENTTSQFELFQKYDKFWKGEYEQLKIICDEFNIEFMSTPFDIESAGFLNDLMTVFKISSSDITNKPFIEHICEFGKPIILSTGASEVTEIQEAVDWICSKGNKLALLHCVLNYPTEDQNANLGVILGLKALFPELIIGYSDHTLPKEMKCLEIATMLGAKIIEKHFTLDKRLPGNDHYHSMDSNDLRVFRNGLDNVINFIGKYEPGYLPSEVKSRQNARRSLVAKKNLSQGQVITPDDITWKRPAYGISPKDIDMVIGSKTYRAIQEDSIITWADIKGTDS